MLVASLDGDPTALLFGRRPLLQIVAPVTSVNAAGKRGGVAVVAPDIRVPLTALLRDMPLEMLFTSGGLDALHQVMIQRAPTTMTVPRESYIHICYATPSCFRPYAGQ